MKQNTSDLWGSYRALQDTIDDLAGAESLTRFDRDALEQARTMQRSVRAQIERECGESVSALVIPKCISK